MPSTPFIQLPIVFIDFPAELKQLFDKFEEYANNQVFSLLDEIDDQVEEWGLVLSNYEKRPRNIQIMNGDDITFTLE